MCLHKCLPFSLHGASLSGEDKSELACFKKSPEFEKNIMFVFEMFYGASSQKMFV